MFAHMRYTNKTGLPDPVVKALTEFEKGEVVEGTRVTTLIDSPRISQLRQEHGHEITEDVSELVYRVMGTAISTPCLRTLPATATSQRRDLSTT